MMGIQRLFKGIDWTCFLLAIILVVVGLIMVFSTSSIIGLSQYQDAYYFVKRHMAFICVGFVGLCLGLKIDINWYRRHIFWGFLGACLLIVLTLIPMIGVRVGGASRWLNLGLFYIQPVEILKFFWVVFLATSLSNKADKMHDFLEGIFPILLVVSIPIILLAQQPDMGNIVLIVLVTLSLLFLSRISWSHIIIVVGTGILTIVTSILLHPYQLVRIKSFLDPWADPLGKNYHVIQSLTAVGSGGLFGQGFGNSHLKFNYLPYHYTDFVFSIICEEGGLLFAGFVLIMFAALAWRGFLIAFRAKSLYPFYLGIGLTLLICLQAFINMGVVLGLLPVTGIPLSLISYGGSSFVTSLFCIGVVLNISRTTS